ncbi:RES domain-containing protein [Methylomagnum ishizawai]|uniref:RES domain-containing protein n=2 Tax=Methylomagnum ishizawai TaxID=1760988 RepID=A0A1Y6CTC3_9GAMM|nr:RES domain-containing protein [Methylomagnum ishizawai]
MDSVACSQCFNDQGLRLDAEMLGNLEDQTCPNCGSTKGKKLSKELVYALAYRFFVWGSFSRTKYGGAPILEFNQHQKTDITFSSWLEPDVKLFERILGVGFFHYGPRLWMFGEIKPLKALGVESARNRIIKRIISEYPSRQIEPSQTFYRIRKGPEFPEMPDEYDSPPKKFLGTGRLDSDTLPVMYVSPDLEVCIHECRVAAADELYVATLMPARSLKVLDLSVVLTEEPRVTEFESLDIAVHMLFMAGKHSYDITRAIALSAFEAGFDGLIYPSYFSLLRLGIMPLRTSYGISHRRIAELQTQEEEFSVPNLALFGRPIESGDLKLKCINKLVLSRVVYDFHFGPVSF